MRAPRKPPISGRSDEIGWPPPGTDPWPRILCLEEVPNTTHPCVEGSGEKPVRAEPSLAITNVPAKNSEHRIEAVSAEISE